MRALLLGLLVLAGAVASQAGAGLIGPPFVRQWTALTGDDTAVLRVKDGTVYFYSANGVGALDQETGGEKWHTLSGTEISSGLEQAGRLWVVQERDDDTQLIALDSASGYVERRITLLPGAPVLAADAGSIYVLDHAAIVSAFDPKSGRRRWSTYLTTSSKQRIGTLTLMATGRMVYAGVKGIGRVGLDPASGIALWRRSGIKVGEPQLALDGDVLLTVGPPRGGMARLDAFTGAVVWMRPGWYSKATLFGDLLIGSGKTGPFAVGKEDGALRWRAEVSGKERGYWGLDEPDRIAGGEEVWVRWSTFVSVDRLGKVRWSREEPFTGNDLYADSERLITSDFNRILCYRRGALPPLPESPAEREAFAKARIAEWEILDDAERKQIAQLKPYVFRPLLARYLEWYRRTETELDGPFGSMYSGLLAGTPETLSAVFEKEDTAIFVQTLNELKDLPYDRQRLDAILQEKGDPNAYIEALIAELKRTPNGERGGGSTLDTVVRSSHPAAVTFMLEALRDPNGSLTWKTEAFRHLAGTGSEEGIAAVRAATPKRAPLTPWYDRVKVTDPRETKPTIRKDAKGRTWAAFQSAVLGNEGDLFIAQKSGEGLGHPLFTGHQSIAKPRDRSLAVRRDPPPDRVIRGEWLRLYPDSPSLRQDSDGDGWTDLVEARLGTDAKKPDTDGDGLKDAVDPCPNAAPRPLGDEEKVYAAAFGAFFFGERWLQPAVLSIKGIEPFEVWGYGGPVLWERRGLAGPLTAQYGGGVNVISFHTALEGAGRGAPAIAFGADRKSARTTIRCYSGGLSGEGVEVVLKKIGEEWFVVDMIGRYMS